jgi:hypothetical protein
LAVCTGSTKASHGMCDGISSVVELQKDCPSTLKLLIPWGGKVLTQGEFFVT